ncbi:MAG: beta-ketoacyl synthase N-terminal-like domain-containing protein [Bdellovibrionales bacterium]
MSESIFERPSSAQRRVVVTGLGVVSPLGLDVQSTWSAALSGQSGVGAITQFDASSESVQIAAEIKGFDPEKYIHKKELKKMDRFIQTSIAATDEALKDSGLQFSDELKSRTGVIIGVGMGVFHPLKKTTVFYWKKGLLESLLFYPQSHN